MTEYLNHTCCVCGTKYHGCDTCDDTKTYMPWRTIVDSIEHYKIYIIIRDYVNRTIDKAEAKNQLNKCEMTGLDNFIPEIKVIIKEILKEETTINKASKKNKTHVNSIDTPKLNI